MEIRMLRSYTCICFPLQRVFIYSEDMKIIPGCDILLIFCLHHVAKESLIQRYKYNYWNNIGPCPQTRMRGLTFYSSIHFFQVKETRLKHFWVALHDTSSKMNRTAMIQKLMVFLWIFFTQVLACETMSDFFYEFHRRDILLH